MPSRGSTKCPRCGTVHRTGRPCPTCASRRPGKVTAYATTRWRQIRAAFLRDNPWCVLCGARATVPDHWPQTRRELVKAGVADPDDPAYLRALCDHHHRTETARRSPGGWNRS